LCNEARPIDLWGEFMGCQGYQRSFTAYLDGELAQGQREAIERHVQRCAECRRDLETLRQTVGLLRSPLLPMEDAPEEVRARLTQKLRAVRQPMSWWERVRLQWRVAGAASQARTWGYGLAATALLFVVGASNLDRWNAPANPLHVGVGVSRTEALPRPDGHVAARLPQPVGEGVQIRSFVEYPVVVGRPAIVYLFVEPGRDLPDGEVRLYPAAGLSVGGPGVLQSDASYLLYQGPVTRQNPQSRWIPVELCAAREGTHILRVTVREAGRVLSEVTIPLRAVVPRS